MIVNKSLIDKILIRSNEIVEEKTNSEMIGVNAAPYALPNHEGDFKTARAEAYIQATQEHIANLKVELDRAYIAYQNKNHLEATLTPHLDTGDMDSFKAEMKKDYDDLVLLAREYNQADELLLVFEGRFSRYLPKNDVEVES